jgi:DNA-binding MarR family transcriptional regulator
MPENGQLSVNDRVLMHLFRFATDVPPEEYSPETTQAGIAVAVGISRTHVPRSVKGLVKDGLVAEITARVRGHERRMNVYTVTGEGVAASERLWQKALESSYSVLGGEATTPRMLGKDIEKLVGKKRALAVISQMRDGVVRLDETRRAPIRDIKEAPEAAHFYGREAELRTMDSFMESDTRVLVVLGNKGYGTTTLTRKFIESQDEEDILWVSLKPLITAAEIESRLVDFGKKVRKQVEGLPDVLGIDNLIIVLDDYYTVSEEVVELFSRLVESGGNAKIIVNARQETPAYNRFYERKHQEAGVVSELAIKGLDEESAKRLLGNEKIEKDALRRITMITHAQPSVLKMLSEDDYNGLKENTVFTPEEIRYLLFLKEKCG